MNQPVEQPYGEVFDRGYQHYDGPRLGRSYAMRRLIIFSMRRGLGIKKRWTAKILPFILYSLAYVPAIIIVGLLAFIPENLNDLGVHSLYGVLETVILVYAAALAPEMLCDDRRENTLALYFSRPLSPIDYLVSKVTAMGLLMSTVAFGPPFILFVGLTLTDNSPARYAFDNVGDLLRIAVFGILVSAFYAAFGLLISLFTTRKGIAAAILIVGTIISTAIANGFFNALDTQSWRGYFVFLSPVDLIDGLRRWIFGLNQNAMIDASDISGILLVAWVCVIVGITVIALERRYLSEE